MKLSNSITWIATAMFAVVLTAGCNRNEGQQGAAESAGKTIDQAQERAGEKMDQAAADIKQQAQNAGDKIDDATITAKVKAAMVGEPGLKALQINVDTADGVVTLTGTVDNSGSLDRATQVAQAIQGVKSVDNRLTVKAG